MRPERTSTAISDHGTPSSRWARRSRSATRSTSARSVSAVNTSTRSGAPVESASGAVKAARARWSMEPVKRDPGGDALARGEDPRPEAAYDGERQHVRRAAVAPPELVGEVEDPAHLGTPERVDRLVRVTHHGEVGPVAGDRLEQPHLAGVGVLVFVHEDVPEPGPQLGLVVGGLDDRAADQVGVVGGALGVEVLEVLLEEPAGGHELRQVVLGAEPAQRGRRRGPSPGPGPGRPRPRGRTLASARRAGGWPATARPPGSRRAARAGRRPARAR